MPWGKWGRINAFNIHIYDDPNSSRITLSKAPCLSRLQGQQNANTCLAVIIDWGFGLCCW